MLCLQLILEKKNVREVVEAGGARILVDLLTLAHLHVNRAVIPTQTNVIEASPDMARDSEKEWYYQVRNLSLLQGNIMKSVMCALMDVILWVKMEGGTRCSVICWVNCMLFCYYFLPGWQKHIQLCVFFFLISWYSHVSIWHLDYSHLTHLTCLLTFNTFQGTNKERAGPFSFKELKECWTNGSLTHKTLCWAQGMDGWHPLTNIPQLKWSLAATVSHNSYYFIKVTALFSLLKNWLYNWRMKRLW